MFTDLDWVFTVQTERVVSKDNTVAITERNWQLAGSATRWRAVRLPFMSTWMD